MSDLYHQAQIILAKDSVAIPIQEKIALVVIDNKVKNVVFDANPYPYYYDSWLG